MNGNGLWELSFYTRLLTWEAGRGFVFDSVAVRSNLQSIARAGIRWIGSDGINWFDPMACDPAEVRQQIRAWLEEFDLRVSSIHFSGPTFASLDQDQSHIQHNLIANIELFQEWQPRSIVIHPGWIDPGPDGQRAMWQGYRDEVARHSEGALIATVAANLKSMARVAQQHGIRLAMENLGDISPLGYFTNLPKLVEAIDEPNVGYCIDTGHAHSRGDDVAAWIRLAGTRLFETHCQDNLGVGNDEHLPAGFGTIDWFKVIAALREIDYPGPITFESNPWPAPDHITGYRLAVTWWQTCERIAARMDELNHPPFLYHLL